MNNQTNPELTSSSAQTRTTRRKEKKRKRGKVRRTLLAMLGVFLIGTIVVIGGLIYTPFGIRLRQIAAETVVSTRHYYLARYIVGRSEYFSLLKQLNFPVYNAQTTNIHLVASHVANPIEIHSIRGPGYTGYVMLVHNPLLVRLVHADVHGAMGEYITDMENRVHASVGVNASGFEDPNGNGWGGLPVGLEMVNGTILHPMKVSPSWATVGFTSGGVMVMGQYSVQQLQALGVRDAMQFHPELVVDGKPMITTGDGGWGYDPRTAIGQARDGTVIFVVTNGRFHGGAGLGASQRQVMDIMMQYHAQNACAMDGGSSAVIAYKGKIMNSPSTIDPNHQRHLPDAWLVFSSTTTANQFG